MTITYHRNLIQGSDAWLAARSGLLTASEIKLILTPKLKIAFNEKASAHLYELLAQRITGHVEPRYINDDMLRGQVDEIDARALYARHYAPVEEVGFITNDEWGFTLGYSPDGLVGNDGLIEVKSRRQKFQVATIVDWIEPEEYILQLQTALLVTGREWIDFISYSGGLPMVTLRVHPDNSVQKAIIEAATAFEKQLAVYLGSYRDATTMAGARLIPTERRIEQEMEI